MPVIGDNVNHRSSIFNFKQNGESSPFVVKEKRWVSLFYWGTFGGATVSLKVSPDGVEWFDVPKYSKSEKSVVSTEELIGSWCKWVVTGASGSTKVNAALI